MDYFDLIICGKAKDCVRYFLRAPAWSGVQPGEAVGFVYPGTDAVIEETALSVTTTNEDSELMKCIKAAFPKHGILDAEYVVRKHSFKED